MVLLAHAKVIAKAIAHVRYYCISACNMLGLVSLGGSHGSAATRVVPHSNQQTQIAQVLQTVGSVAERTKPNALWDRQTSYAMINSHFENGMNRHSSYDEGHQTSEKKATTAGIRRVLPPQEPTSFDARCSPPAHVGSLRASGRSICCRSVLFAHAAMHARGSI